jgi:predicted nuclease of predicted toxin-antitoxin system
VRFKVDENLPIEVAEILRTAGHDAATVNDEAVGGASDPDLASLVRRESRTLIITLDTGFADIRSYPPKEYKGLVVLRLARQDKDHVLQTCNRLVKRLASEELVGQLWSLKRVGSESDGESSRATRLRAGARPLRGADPRGNRSLRPLRPWRAFRPRGGFGGARRSSGGSRTRMRPLLLPPLRFLDSHHRATGRSTGP